jgi:replication-associated recombination protein RarA
MDTEEIKRRVSVMTPEKLGETASDTNKTSKTFDELSEQAKEEINYHIPFMAKDASRKAERAMLEGRFHSYSYFVQLEADLKAFKHYLDRALYPAMFDKETNKEAA